MAGVSKEQVEQARRVDLLEYLQATEPHSLRRVGKEYCLAEHDSLKISPNGKWNWHSRGFGGRNALDFLIKVRGIGFVDAVETLCGSRTVPAYTQPHPEQERPAFRLPPPAPDNNRVTAYLQSRGLSRELIDRCIKAGILYESKPFPDKSYRNAVFVGKDAQGDPRFACARGIIGQFKGDVAGSDKRFGFCLPPESQAGRDKVAVFESPIDALSHFELTGEDCYRLSLAGTAPLAFQQFFEQNPQISRVSLCLDDDAAGKEGSAVIEKLLEFAGVTVTRDLPCLGKDYNEALLATQRAVKKQLQREFRNGDPAL